MAKYISAIRQDVRQVLQDEFKDIDELVWSDDELEKHILACLVEISQKQPYQKKVTVTSDGTKVIDLTELTEYESLISVVKAEYEVDQDPQQFRNVSRFGDSLTINISNAPAPGDHIHLYCNLLHTLDESTSTLNPIQENLLVLGASGKAAISKSRAYFDKVNTGGNTVPDKLYNWGRGRDDEYKDRLKMSVKVIQTPLYSTD